MPVTGAATVRAGGPAAVALGVALVVALAGCGGSGARALIPVDIAPGSVAGLRTVDVSVAEVVGNTEREVRRQRFDWTAAAGTPLQVGVYLPDGYSGSVSVGARGYNAAGVAIASASRITLTVGEGERALLVQLLLAPEVPGGDGGSGDAGGDRPDAGADGPGGSDGAPPTDGPVPDGGSPDLPVDSPGDAPVVENRTWTPGADIEQDPLAGSYTPDVAIDGRGNVIVAWREGVGVKLRRQDGATRAWGAVQTIESRGTTDAVQVAMSAGGRAVIVWYMRTSEVDPGLQGLWARHSADAGATWSEPVLVHAGPVYHELALAVAADGAARVAWQESSENINSLWSAHLNPATTTFSDVAEVKPGSDADERYPRVAMSEGGAGLLAWVQDDDDGEDSIWAAELTAGAVGTPAPLDSYGDAAGEVDVAIAADGSRGMAVWQQRGDNTADLYYNAWTPASGSGWRGPQRVLTADWVSAPAVVIDATGQATVAFTQPIVGYRWNVVHTRYHPQTGWTGAQALETSNQASGLTTEDPIPRLGLDAAGNVHAVWRRKVSATADTASVIVRRYSVAAVGWQAEVVLGTVDGLQAYHPEVAVAAEGRAAATFYYLDPGGTGGAASFNVHVAFFR